MFRSACLKPDFSIPNNKKEIEVGRSPSGLAVDPSGSRLYVANRDDDNVMLVDTATRRVIATIPAGRAPFGVAVAPDRRELYTANVRSGDVSVIDLEQLKTVASIKVGLFPYAIATVPVGEYPEGLMLHPDGRRLYVASWFGGVVSVIDVDALEVIDEIETDEGSRAYGKFLAPR